MNQLRLPVENYTTGDYLKFGDKIRRRLVLWATHLGDDVVASAGEPVYAIGNGEVVLSEMKLGSENKKSWGGVLIIRHERNLPRQDPLSFLAIYGHINNLQVKTGDHVTAGQKLGEVAQSNTPENGMWQQAHLHFAIYTGPYPVKEGEMLPGYFRPDAWLTGRARTKLAWWHEPKRFILDSHESRN